MQSTKKHVVPRIQQECPNAKGHHCCAQKMNLSAKKVISDNPILRDVLDSAQTLLKLLKLSPSRGSLLNQFKKELEDADGDLESVKGLITLYMHHWTVKADELQRILSNYVQIMSTLVCCLDDREFRRSLDASHSAEVSGMLQQCQSFSFFIR